MWSHLLEIRGVRALVGGRATRAPILWLTGLTALAAIAAILAGALGWW